MQITLENIGAYIAIIGFAVGLVKFSIIAPLQKDNKNIQKENMQQIDLLRKEIDQLRISIERLAVSIEAIEKSISDVRERVILVESSAKQAHRRLDGLEAKVYCVTKEGRTG